MKKQIAIAMLFTLSLGVILAGCIENVDEGTTSAGEGTLVLYVSDMPADIDDFDVLNVSFYKVRIFNEINGTEDGWNETEINETVDLTQLVGPNSTQIVNMTLAAGNYSKVELYVNHTYGLVDGNETEVFVPSGKLMITKSFNISANETLRFVFDINVVKRGHQNKYNLLPVISESGVVGQDLDEEDFVEV